MPPSPLLVLFNPSILTFQAAPKPEGPPRDGENAPEMLLSWPQGKKGSNRATTWSRARQPREPVVPHCLPRRALPTRRPHGSPPYSWHLGHGAQRRQADSPYRGGFAWDRQDAETALPPPRRGTGPYDHKGDRRLPPVEILVQDPRRLCFPGRVGLTVLRVQGLGPRAVRRSCRPTGTASDAPKPGGQSHTHFIHRHRGLPTRTQVSTKRGKRSRMAGFRRTRPRMPGECSSGVHSTL